MFDSHSKSVLRLFTFIASASNGLFGVLLIVASFVVACYPSSGWNVMMAVLAITGVFFVALSIALLVVLRPWRKDLSFSTKEDEMREIIGKLTKNDELITKRLVKIETRLKHIEKSKRGEG